MTDTRCFIHIGAPKTGSTFLQKVFYENREQLANEGILYPDVSLRGFGHHDLAFLLSGGYPEWATPQSRSIEELGKDLATVCAGHAGSILLSSEIFYLFPNPEALRRLLDSVGALRLRQPRVIVYLRRQDDAHESWYNQRVKAQGEIGPIEASIKRYQELWDYERQLALWAAAFGQESLVVRRYPPLPQQGSLLDDALNILGIPNVGGRPAPEPINISENRDILSFQRQLNRLPLSPQEKRRFHKELMILSEKARGRGIFDERPLLGPSERRAIMASYAASNAAVARCYFAGEPLFPDVDNIAAEAPVAPVEEGLTDRKMIYILGWLLEYAQPN